MSWRSRRLAVNDLMATKPIMVAQSDKHTALTYAIMAACDVRSVTPTQLLAGHRILQLAGAVYFLGLVNSCGQDATHMY